MGKCGVSVGAEGDNGASGAGGSNEICCNMKRMIGPEQRSQVEGDACVCVSSGLGTAESFRERELTFSSQFVPPGFASPAFVAFPFPCIC